MPRAIGWPPALLSSRGSVIARPRFGPRTLIPRTGALRLGDGGSRGSRFANRCPNSTLRQARSPPPVQVLPPFQFFGPTTAAAKAVHAAENAKALVFFPVGVDGADFEVLGRLSPRSPIKLRGLAFRELFQWLSNSLSGVSKSKVGDVLQLAPPDTTPKGWAVIE
jgi:hypothetical protein